VNFKGAKPQPELHLLIAVVVAQLCQLSVISRRPGLLPAAAQKGVAFGGVKVKVVASLSEKTGVGTTRIPGPGAAEKTFDNAEGRRGSRLHRLKALIRVFGVSGLRASIA